MNLKALHTLAAAASLTLSLLLVVMPVGYFYGGAALADSGSGIRVDAEISGGFQPASVTVAPGTTVRWTNKEDKPHTVTSNTGAFDSGTLAKGGRYFFTFSTPGAYPYGDKYSSFKGNVTVTGATAPPTPAPAPVPGPTPPPTPGGNKVQIGDNFFTPASFSVTAGASLTWTNSGQKAHSVTSNTGLFNSGMVSPGQSFTFTFTGSGSFAYYCMFHGGQNGSVAVTGGSPAPAPSPTPTPTPSPSPTPTPPPGAGTVQIGDNNYTPASYSVAAGGTVTWTNSGQTPHSVTGDAGTFNSGMLMPGQSFSFAFTGSGSFAYHCMFHSGQNGSVIVTGGSPAPTPTPGPTPTPAPNPAPAPAPGGANIQVGDNLYSPASLSVAAGSTVTWTNSGQAPHSVTSDTGLFNSGMLMPRQSFSFAFTGSGSFTYHCMFHSGQNGSVIVTGGSPASGVSPAPVEPFSLAVGAVMMSDQSFTPASLTVRIGTIVTWVNAGQKQHTVTADNSLFHSGLLDPGQTYSFTFHRPGTYKYGSVINNGLGGTITVTANGPGPAQTPTLAGITSIAVSDSAFSTSSLTIPVGSVVAWTNKGIETHSVTSDTRLFDSGPIFPEGGYGFTFKEPGTYSYYCKFHNGMTGSMTVTNPTPPAISSTTPASTMVGSSVQIGDNLYGPASITLKTGATVTWTNGGQVPHTVTSDTGLFNSGMLMPGQSFSYTFANSGAFLYHCMFHSGQNGSVAVGSASPAPAAPTPPPVPASSAPATSLPTSTPVPAAAPASLSVPDAKSIAFPVPAPAAQSNAKGIEIGDNLFAPAASDMPVRTTVTWTNKGKMPHTVTSNTGLFDSGLLMPGQSFAFTFANEGSFAYRCMFHNGQSGAITVGMTNSGSSRPVGASRDSTGTSGVGTNNSGPSSQPTGSGATLLAPATESASVIDPGTDGAATGDSQPASVAPPAPGSQDNSNSGPSGPSDTSGKAVQTPAEAGSQPVPPIMSGGAATETPLSLQPGPGHGGSGHLVVGMRSDGGNLGSPRVRTGLDVGASEDGKAPEEPLGTMESLAVLAGGKPATEGHSPGRGPYLPAGIAGATALAFSLIGTKRLLVRRRTSRFQCPLGMAFCRFGKHRSCPGLCNPHNFA